MYTTLSNSNDAAACIPLSDYDSQQIQSFPWSQKTRCCQHTSIVSLRASQIIPSSWKNEPPQQRWRHGYGLSSTFAKAVYGWDAIYISLYTHARTYKEHIYIYIYAYRYVYMYIYIYIYARVSRPFEDLSNDTLKLLNNAWHHRRHEGMDTTFQVHLQSRHTVETNFTSHCILTRGQTRSMHIYIYIYMHMHIYK